MGKCYMKYKSKTAQSGQLRIGHRDLERDDLGKEWPIKGLPRNARVKTIEVGSLEWVTAVMSLKIEVEMLQALNQEVMLSKYGTFVYGVSHPIS